MEIQNRELDVKAWSSGGRLLFSSRISAAMSKMEPLYRDIPCLGKQRERKLEKEH